MRPRVSAAAHLDAAADTRLPSLVAMHQPFTDGSGTSEFVAPPPELPDEYVQNAILDYLRKAHPEPSIHQSR